MSEDVLNLKEFYASPLGQAARRIIARRIRGHWPNVAGMDVLGIGYASPYLRMFHGEARAIAALMPQEQGAIKWPSREPSRTALVVDTALPLRDMAAECVLVVHGLEHAQSRDDFLREIWRVLMPEGKLIVVIPNRRGPWARLDTTPFGHGRPYSSRQITRLLTKANFELSSITPCLFMPPFQLRAIGPATLVWERIGMRIWPAFSGVIVVEAVKRVYSGVRVTALKPAFAPIPAIPGLNPARRINLAGEGSLEKSH